jgi:hypothetical protein
MRYLETGVTYRSHGQHMREDGEARGHQSVLNHICMTQDLEATVSVLSDATTDHFPVIVSMSVDKVAPTTKSIERRNLARLTALLSFERSSPGPGLTSTRSGTRTRSWSSSTG